MDRIKTFLLVGFIVFGLATIFLTGELIATRGQVERREKTIETIHTRYTEMLTAVYLGEMSDAELEYWVMTLQKWNELQQE